MLASLTGLKKLGQPVPDVYLVVDTKRSFPQATQRYTPSRSFFQWAPEHDISVPFLRVILYTSGGSSCIHSSSLFSTLVVEIIFPCSTDHTVMVSPMTCPPSSAAQIPDTPSPTTTIVNVISRFIVSLSFCIITCTWPQPAKWLHRRGKFGDIDRPVCRQCRWYAFPAFMENRMRGGAA